MKLSGADLHVGEILGQVRVRVAVGRLHPDRRSLGVVAGCLVAELAIRVVSPGVGVAVAAHSQGKTIAWVFSCADLVEPDASAGAVWRGDGGGFPAQLAALVGADAPCAVPACGRPVGGQGQVPGDRPAEIVGDFADEPSVEQEAFTSRVGGGPIHPAVRGGETLVSWFGFSSACVEVDRERGSWFGASGQCLVDRVVKAPGERLPVLPAGDEDDGLSRLMGGHVRLPGFAGLAEFERLAVQTGCFQDERGCGVGPGWLAGLALPVQAPREHAALPVDGGDPVAGFGGLHVLLASVVRPGGLAAWLPGPDAAILAGDHGLVLVGGGPAGFHAFRQADLDHGGGAVGQVPGLSFRVQNKEPLVEGLGLDDARARILLDSFWFGFSDLACVPGPGLPVRVHDEDPAGGGGSGDGLRLSGQPGRGLFGGFRVRVLAAGLAGLEDVDPTLSVHGQEPVIAHADAGELGVPAGVEDCGCGLLAGPGVDPLVESECGLPAAAGCGL